MKFTCLLVIALLILSCIAGSVFADNSARIQILQVQQQQLLKDIQQAQNVIEQKKAELLRLDGAIRELKSQDNTEKKDK